MPDQRPMPIVRGERPRRRGNRKLLIFLFVFFISLLGILFFQSSFSKVHTVAVEGNRLLTTAEIMEVAGVSAGDHFFAVSGREIEERIEKLGAAEEVKVIKRFPGSVTIDVKEYPVVALELTPDGEIAGLLSNGTAVPYGNVENAASRPILSGWDDEAGKRQLTKALATIPPGELQDVSEIRPSPTTSYPDRIVIYTRSQFEVLTTISYLAEKISLLDDYVYDMKADDMTTGQIVLLETDYGQPFEETEGAGASETEEDASSE
ncbi:FtsQ-type POTRA domain-containing protein [Paenibacillus sp. TRM 82003]|nr:FtsQ-type POTRA domain-containing protein [Paenibacillus sp. TRM 82003]